jgi:hypothetical protein
MSRFYEADEKVQALANKIIYDRFPALRGAKIKVVMDPKPKIDKILGRMTFAYIKLANEVEKFLSKSGVSLNGLDYLMFVNDLVWELASDKDRARIISHELRHGFVDEEGNYKIVKHDIEDFYAEIESNKDDPMWGQALSTVAVAKFEQTKAEERAQKKASGQ